MANTKNMDIENVNIGDIDTKLEDLMTPYHEIMQVNGNALYLGNQSAVGAPADAWNYSNDDIKLIGDLLKELGIKTIVCCADGICKFPGEFVYYQIPARDTPKFDYFAYFDIAADSIHAGLQRGSVIVHCNAGVSRSTTALIAYLIKYHKMSLYTAVHNIRTIRSCIDISNFYDQLETYVSVQL